jgi:uncharacterized membrane protein
MVAALAHLTDAWSAIYANSRMIRTTVNFAHVGGLVAGGGCAIAADRDAILAVRRDAEWRAHHLRRLLHVHQAVIAGLVLVVGSGVLLFAADVDTYWHSTVFWAKMAAVFLLLANGALVVRAGHRAAANAANGWRALRTTAIASLVLWSLTTLLGVALSNAG